MRTGLGVRIVMKAGVFLAGACAACGQGSLTPPGAPAPMLRTLEQVEPRTPISGIPVTISTPGAYYLTTNLTGTAGQNGITISGSDITLDLNGFALIGGSGSLAGVQVSGARNNITVRNGTVREWGAFGVAADWASNSRFQDLAAYTNGFDTSGFGLYLGSDSSITRCLARNNQYGIATGDRCFLAELVACGNTSRGVWLSSGCTLTRSTVGENGSDGVVADDGCTVTDTTAYGNGSNGIETRAGCTVTRCTAYDNGSLGIVVGDGSTVTDCSAARNANDGITGYQGCTIKNCTAFTNRVGIVLGDSSTVKDCTAALNSQDGIQAPYGCYVVGNQSDMNLAAGIHVTGRECRVEGNNVSNNARGIDVDGDRNLIIRNSARDNGGLNYEIVESNRVGVIALPPLSGDISGDTDPDALGMGSTDPWANIAY
ncbi:MAG: right-handed parallel beta-helix repeat-containing protein [Kiritimatiellae bacterium]|nr:right-handed parallel beta-helix repeat-containing protein [Kiritimatiellia bacterium]